TEEAEPHAVRWENGVPTDLGALPGEISVAFAINELGQAAGLSWPVAVQVVFPVGRAIVWDGQETIDLSAGADVAGSGAMSINDRGEVVGWIVPNGGAMHAARWAGGRTEYLTCEGYERSEALATNEAGHVVGWAEGAGTGYERNAMVWGGGAPIALDLFTQEGTPARWAKANDINANGVVAGAVHRLDDPIAAVIWEPWAGSRTVLGTLGGSQSEAYAINDAGQVVGWALTADGDPHAFVWQAGAMIDLSADDASGRD
ncbi:MAG: hypothetical protein IT336_07290, partial [Thermomicrobiales bacterium]|nr:hypothetical protein [Thermomicrobiales bacterium]